MALRWVALITVLLHTVVVSQPLFYWLALGRASAALGPPSYVELRQRINAAIAGPLVRLYAAALASACALAAMAVHADLWPTAIGALAGAAGLVIDLAIAVRRNVPINRLVDGWTPATIPADWPEHRARWSAALTLRSWVLVASFIALATGVIAFPAP